MSNSIESEIVKIEECLRLAMLQSDVAVLDELLSPDLIFTNHFGHVMTKGDDLSAHKSGLLRIEEISLSKNRIQIIDNVAVVTVQAHLVGSYAGERSENDFRFTRIWAASKNGAWHVVAAHSCVVV